MMSHLCNRCVRELMILARTWFAFGLPSNPGVTGGQAQTRGQAWELVLRITYGLASRHSSGRSGYTQDPQRPRTFKPRRQEIGTWKTNTFKEAGRLVKTGPTFDQLLSKYVKKKVSPSDRPAKRPRSPIHEQHQVRPIGPPHQSKKMKGHTIQLRPNCWGLVLKCYELRTRQHRKC
jgi:hypothetical protein